ncbi:CLCA_X family protein [Marinobacter sediminicola]|uniref:CLCA_X family protein n=1 Tax=Marinobacter sediminicola TaxID=3072994 RepID=UPI002811E1C9|nr:CLCA_X family protein [Marinobacter sp. F26243]
MTMSHPISFVTVRRQFDFRSIEVGRWVTPSERDRAADRFYRALCDLMAILQGPESLISLRGSLGMQYGIGGRPGVSAHYIPATRQMALAKNAGAGSLAHEWFHAFDHYMGNRAFHGLGKLAFASSGWLGSAKQKKHPLNSLLSTCFKTILLTEDGTAPSSLFQASKEADKQLRVLYYAKPEELCARAFEAFIEDSTPNNSFLVRGTVYSDEASAGLYPNDVHRQRINDAFQDYFSALGAALYRERAKAG